MTFSWMRALGGVFLLGCSGQTLEPVKADWDSGDGGTSGSASGGTAGSGGTSSGGTSNGGSGGSATGCSLAVTGSGELPASLTPTANLDGIAVVATDTGFVIAHRDRNASAGVSRTIVTFLSDAGSLGAPAPFDTPSCAKPLPHDGVGAAFRDGHGLVAASLPNCDAQKGAGAVFLPFDTNGNVSNAAGPQNPVFSELTFGRVSGVATAAQSNEFEVVYRAVTSSSSDIERVVMQGSAFKVGEPIAHPFSQSNLPYGLIASSPSIRALLAPTGAETEIQVSEATGDLEDLAGTFQLPYSPDWAALTAWNVRAAAVVPTTGGLAFLAVELSAGIAQQVTSGTIATPGAAGAAMTTLRDHLFIAIGNPSSVSIATLNGADGNLDASSTSSSSLPTSLTSGFDGTQLAIAAARSRVAVVWLTAPELSSGQPTGHWALLECPE